jgi:DNA-binding MarR family transcriptional regulator
MARTAPEDFSWTLTTPYARVLLHIAREPDVRVADLAAATGLTVRTVHDMIRQLVHDGAIERTRVGRRNRYRIVEGYRPSNPDEAALDLGTWLARLPCG